jgi:geranylgeranyl diphosphate synthase type I
MNSRGRRAACATGHSADVVSDTQCLVRDRLKKLVSASGLPMRWTQFMPGKMLRTRWAARLAESGELHVAADTIVRACAAIELTHTASLCHDDVIDGGFLRRQQPTLWRVMGPTAAILVGDLLLCEAMDVLVSVENGGLVEPFTTKLREVCAAELEQDLGSRGKVLEEDACLRLARGKSGPFFAFVGYACGGGQPDLRAALEAAGYQVGTLYQMADDLLDVVGSAAAGKTLGTDAKQRKFTVPQMAPKGPARARARIRALRDAILDDVQAWPPVRAAFLQFFQQDLQPVFAQFDQRLGECMRAAV